LSSRTRGRDTADQVYDVLRDLEKQKLRDIDIKTAATVNRKDDGKLKLRHRRRLTVGKGVFGGGAVGLILASTGAGLLVGAGIGALLGSTKSGDRRDAKEFLEDKLGPNDSALVILVKDADWSAVDDAVAPFNGTELAVELSAEAEAQVAELAEKADVVALVQVDVEVDESDVDTD
jgi:uncharacterized membrane protein